MFNNLVWPLKDVTKTKQLLDGENRFPTPTVDALTELLNIPLPEGETSQEEEDEGQEDQAAITVQLLLHGHGLKDLHNGGLKREYR